MIRRSAALVLAAVSSDEGLKKIVEDRQWLMLDVSHTNVMLTTVASLRKTHPHIDIRFEQ